jgi:hypothetical protein
MQLEELRPAHGHLASSRDWVEVVAPQEVAHSDRVNVMSRVRQGTLDAAVPPGGILFGHADHKRFDLVCNTGSSKRSAVPAPIKLLGDQPTIPTHKRVGHGSCGDFFEVLVAERVG